MPALNIQVITVQHAAPQGSPGSRSLISEIMAEKPYSIDDGRFQQRPGDNRFPSEVRGSAPASEEGIRSDEEICREVCEVIARNAAADALEIAVAVRQGEVHLSGAVSTPSMGRLIEELVSPERIPGVRLVRNHLDGGGCGARPG